MRDLPKILFVGTTESDVFSVISQLENHRFYKQRAGVVHGGLWREASVRVLLTGPDADVAAAAVRESMELDKPLVLISLGLATALDANLQVGDLVVAQNFEFAPGAVGPMRAPALKLGGRLFDLVRIFLKQNPSLGSRFGTIVAVDEVPHEPERKLALFERSRADIADSTGLVIARVAEEWGIPFAVLRAIFELSHERLPDYERVVREKGRLSTTRMIGRLAVNPTSFFTMRGLSARARTCRDRMDLFADSFWKIWRAVREAGQAAPVTAAPAATPTAIKLPHAVPKPATGVAMAKKPATGMVAATAPAPPPEPEAQVTPESLPVSTQAANASTSQEALEAAWRSPLPPKA